MDGIWTREYLQPGDTRWLCRDQGGSWCRYFDQTANVLIHFATNESATAYWSTRACNPKNREDCAYGWRDLPTPGP